MKKRGRKRKIALIILVLLATAFFSVFNTSTRYGRWLLWQEADYGDLNRFAFVLVDNDPANARRFEPAAEGSAAAKAIQDYRVEEQSITEFMGDHDSTALVIVCDGEIVVEEYFQGHQRDSLQMSFSCTKSVISLLLGIALDEGLIESIDDPVSRYVEGLREDFQYVTIRHLMTMTSGVSERYNSDGIPLPWSDKIKAYYDPDLRSIARSVETVNRAGKEFEYHDLNPVFVGMLLEEVTGVSPMEYLSEKIWKPAGMQFPARWSVDSNRHKFVKAEAGFNATAVDMARLGWLAIDPDQELVSQKWLETSVRDNLPSELYSAKLRDSVERAQEQGRISDGRANHVLGIRYGLYWWGIEREGRYDFYANGHMGQFIYVSPDARLVIVRNGPSHGGSDDYEFGRIFFEIASGVIEAESGETRQDERD